MTLTSFIEMLQVNEELLQITNEFLAYVDTCGATLRPRIAKTPDDHRWMLVA